VHVNPQRRSQKMIPNSRDKIALESYLNLRVAGGILDHHPVRHPREALVSLCYHYCRMEHTAQASWASQAFHKDSEPRRNRTPPTEKTCLGHSLQNVLEKGRAINDL